MLMEVPMEESAKTFEERPVNTRFIQLMKHLGYNKNSLAVAIGVSAPSIGHIQKHRNYPGFEIILKFLELHPSINANWLIKGVGEMFVPADERDLREEIHSLSDDIKFLQEKERQNVSTIKYWMGKASEWEKAKIKIEGELTQIIEKKDEEIKSLISKIDNMNLL